MWRTSARFEIMSNIFPQRRDKTKGASSNKLQLRMVMWEFQLRRTHQMTSLQQNVNLPLVDNLQPFSPLIVTMIKLKDMKILSWNIRGARNVKGKEFLLS
ncbi:hypothetical protein VNO77_20321 [Canavalia gladiata]|uniref:Uncharacterized protein n=1 Tax=Canavalia gladiata TaxID=3824 RepID=A0AAN9LSZ2_CANGL